MVGGLGFEGRKTKLDAWRRILSQRADEFIALISSETGKPVEDAQLEVVLAITTWTGPPGTPAGCSARAGSRPAC